LGSFKYRLLILIVLLVAMAQGVTVVLALAYLNRSTQNQSALQLRATHAMLDQILSERARLLNSAADVLVADFAFREAVASQDQPTIVSALRNQAQRVNADLAILYGTDGRVLAATVERVDAAKIVADLRLPTVERTQGAPTFAVIGDRPYQLVTAPLRAPDTIGWVALGFTLDLPLAQQLRTLGGTEVSFISHGVAGGGAVISTLESRDSDWLAANMPAASGQPALTRVGATDYLTLSAPLLVNNGRIELILQRSQSEAAAQFRQMRTTLLLICVAALLVAVAIAWRAGLSAVRPLGELVVAARRIEQGDYEQAVDVAGGGEEFGHLAHTLNAMQAGIRQREQHIVHQGTHDALTGLPNRVGLRALLVKLAPELPALSVALIDVHRFRDINASVGHHTGDLLLQALSRRLSALSGPPICIARVGVDQFMAVLSADDEQAVGILQGLALELRQGLAIGPLQLSVQICVGISQWRAPQCSVDDLLRQADIALVEAKAKGWEMVRYQPSHDAEHRRRITLVADLRQAIAGDQLTLAFQPLLLMTNREVIGFEALVRWTHPTLGAISPAEFVPLAERASAVSELTRWVLAAAIRQLQRWRAQQIIAEVAVNLSASDIIDPAQPDYILGLLAEYDVPPSQLMLEVTESAIMRDPARAAIAMQRLRGAGIRFAIDDFGTGHSSLAQLHALPVDELKIDRSFVQDVERSASNTAIVRSTIELAHNLGLKVVAEGIETPEAWTMLLRLGCDVAQGYLISRPMPAAAVDEWLRSQRAKLARALSDAEQTGTLTALRPRLA
jgi:diguanylate cyclase